MSTAMNIQRTEKNGDDRSPAGIGISLLFSVALSAGCFATLFSMFENPAHKGITWILVITLPVVMFFPARQRTAGKYMMFYIPAIVAIYAIIFYKEVWSGALQVVNALIVRVNEETASGFIPYETEVSVTYAAMFLFPLILLIASAIAHSVYRREPGPAFLFIAIPVFAALLMKGTPSLLPFFLLVVGMVWLFLQSPNQREGKGRLILPVLFLCGLAVFFGLYVTIFPIDGYTPLPGIDKARSALVSGEERMRYGGGRVDGLSRGDLTDTHSIVYTEEPVLKLELEKPEAMHLRGFVGSEYCGERWKEEKEGAYGMPYVGIFKWLSDRGLYPQAQMGSLYRMDPDYEFASVKVEVVKADRKYMYAPYEAAMVGDLAEGKSYYEKDTTIRSRGLLGKKAYEYKIFLPISGGYNSATVQELLSKAEKSKNYDDFADAEKVYRKFVYDTYLDVPEEEVKNLETLGVKNARGKTAEFAIFSLREVYVGNYEYDYTYEGASDGEDELSHFIHKSKTGNDMHFATAATLYLREAGIPARYVEGYYLSDGFMLFFEDMTNLKLDVPDSLNHAWVEIYVDGVGWQPVEVIPGFYDREKELADTDKDADKEKEIDQATYPDTVEVIIPGEEEMGAEDDQPWFQIMKIVIPILVAVLALIMGFEWMGRYRLRKRLASFAVPGRDSVARMYKYIGALMKFNGLKICRNVVGAIEGAGERYDEITTFGYEEILKLVYKARFSRDGVDDNEHKDILLYIRELARGIYEKSTPLKRFLMRRIRFLY